MLAVFRVRRARSSAYTAFQRQHVAFVYDKDAKTQSIYIDGNLDKTCSAPWLASGPVGRCEHIGAR